MCLCDVAGVEVDKGKSGDMVLRGGKTLVVTEVTGNATPLIIDDSAPSSTLSHVLINVYAFHFDREKEVGR